MNPVQMLSISQLSYIHNIHNSRFRLKSHFFFFLFRFLFSSMKFLFFFSSCLCKFFLLRFFLPFCVCFLVASEIFFFFLFVLYSALMIFLFLFFSMIFLFFFTLYSLCDIPYCSSFILFFFRTRMSVLLQLFTEFYRTIHIDFLFNLQRHVAIYVIRIYCIFFVTIIN